MPIVHDFDQDRGLIVTRLHGAVTDADLASQPAAMYEDPRFSPTYARIVDLTGVEALEVSGEAIRRLARQAVSEEGTRRALVVSRDASYGLSRMFQSLRDANPEENRIFWSMDDALAWLGIA